MSPSINNKLINASMFLAVEITVQLIARLHDLDPFDNSYFEGTSWACSS